MNRHYQPNRQTFRSNLQEQYPQSQHSFPSHLQSPQPYPQNHRLASSLFYFTLNRIEKHLERYFTRYYDFYIDEGRWEEAEAISNDAVHQLARKLKTQHEMEQAAVMIMCDNYSRIGLPQAPAAREKLKAWAEYLYAHLDQSMVPTQGQQRYEQQMMEQAHTSADELWQAFRTFNKDPVGWGNEWAHQQALKVYEQLEQFGEAAHRQWLLENQPDRVPPPKTISKLRPEAENFTFLPRPKPSQPHEKDSAEKSVSISKATIKTENSDSGYDSSNGSSSNEEQKSKIEPKENVITRPPSPTISKPEVQQSVKDENLGDLCTVPTPDENLANSSTIDGTFVLTDTEEETNKMLRSPKVESMGTRTRRSSIDSKQCFNKTIIMFSRLKANIPVTAIFDTGAEGGNWVSKELITQLGLEEDTWQCPSRKLTSSFLDASGRPICGSSYIDLSWQWFSTDKYKYEKWHKSKFYILPSDHIQVLFGTDYIREHRLIQFNEDATLAPLTANQPMTLSISQQIAENKRVRDAKKTPDKKEHRTPAASTSEVDLRPETVKDTTKPSRALLHLFRNQRKAPEPVSASNIQSTGAVARAQSDPLRTQPLPESKPDIGGKSYASVLKQS